MRRVKRAAAVLFSVALVFALSHQPSGQTVEIEGYVHRSHNQQGNPIGVVTGAVVSTSLDDTTAVTDRTGHFRLRTTARVGGDQFFVVTVQYGDFVIRDRTMAPRMKNRQFVLSGGRSYPR